MIVYPNKMHPETQKFHFEYKKWIALHSILLETEKNDSADSEDIELREQEEKSAIKGNIHLYVCRTVCYLKAVGS